MKPAAYALFRDEFHRHLVESQGAAEEALRAHDGRTRELETKHRNLLRAIASDADPSVLVERLNVVDTELKQMRAKREEIVPPTIELPENLPELYQALLDDLAATLSTEAVAGRASDAIHKLVDRITVRWDAQASALVAGVGGPNLGIDFTGGVQMVLRSDAPIPLAELRAAIAAGVPGDASLQAFGDPNEALIRVQGEAGQATVAAVEAAAAQAVPGAVFDQIDLVGPTISGELATTGLIALSLAVLAMLAYIWVRFEWHFAAGAIAVLFLDITKTFGVIAVTGWEVNLTTIVALLTLIGYSVNDKVVVYDRIREHLRGGSADEPLSDVIDRSLNQVLARCIFTSGTTLAALLPMAIWGGPAVAGFAWPMIAGVVIATGSSLFVSGPVLAWLAARTPAASCGHALQQAG